MNDRPMAFTEHLGELRDRLLRSVVALLVAFTLAYAYHEELFRILAAPILGGLRAHGIYRLQALQVTEAIVVYLQASLVGAVVLAAPYVLYQLWAFVAPGLLRRERRIVLPVVGLVSAFFLLGLAFCYFVFLPMVVDFLVAFTIGTGDIALLPTVEKTFGLVTTFLLVFGLVFEMPLLMFFLAALGVVRSSTFLRMSRYVVVLSFVVGAIFTPPDPLSQILMAVPLCALYLVGVAFAWAGGTLRRSGRPGAARAVVGGVFLVFATAVGLAGWLWNRPSTADSARASLPADTVFAIRSDPATRAGRAISELRSPVPGLSASAWVATAGPGGRTWSAIRPTGGCPGVEPAPWWMPSSSPAACRISGPEPSGMPPSDPAFDTLDDPARPVAGVALPACAALLLPPGLAAGPVLRFWIDEPSAGVGRLVLRFDGDPTARSSASAWAWSVRERLAPGRPLPGLDASPVGETLAWSEGDLEVRQEDDATLVSLEVLPERAARMAARLAAAAIAACGPATP